MESIVQKQDEDAKQVNLKFIAGFGAAILIFMSSMRMILETKDYGIPILNFVSFSNIIAYVLDIAYGLTYYFIFAGLFYLLRKWIYMGINLSLTNKTGKYIFWIILVGIFIFSIIRTGILYWHPPITYERSVWLKIYIFSGVSAFGLIVKFSKLVSDMNFLLLFMIFIAIWLFMKVVVCQEIYLRNLRNQTYSEIEFKDSTKENLRFKKKFRLVSNTMDFVFAYDSATASYIAYPMAEIFSIKTNGDQRNDICK